MKKHNKLILHVGSFKAGSTSIQEELSTNDAFLLTEKIQFIDARRYDFSKEVDVKMFMNIISPDVDVHIASSEFLFPLEKNVISKIKVNLDMYFSDIKIFIYVRDPIKILPSWASENIKHGYNKSDLGIAMSSIDVWTVVDYIKRFVDVFGIDKVDVNKFDTHSFIDSDLITDFLYRTTNKKITFPKTLSASNRAITAEATLLAKALNGNKEIRKILPDLLGKIPGHKIINTEESVQRIKNNDRGGYKYLKDMFGIEFDESADGYSISQPIDIEYYFEDIVKVLSFYFLSNDELDFLKQVKLHAKDENKINKLNSILNRYSHF